MIRRLRIKFVLINMTIVTVMLFVMFGMITTITQTNLERESLLMMRTVTMNSLQPGRPDQVFSDIRLPFFVLQINEKNDLLETGGGYYDLSDRDFLRMLVGKAVKSGNQTGVLGEYNLRYSVVETPLTRHIVFADISSEISTMNHLMKSCVTIGVLSFLIFLVLSVLLSGWAVRPVERAWEQQRQFVADASHELKTPLTVVLTNAQLLQSREYGAEKNVQFAENILVKSRQMKALVESLLSLARADSGLSEQVLKKLSLSEVTEAAVLPYEPVYFEAGIGLETEIAPDIWVKGSEEHLRRAVEILLDNACKYAAKGSIVNAKLYRQGGKGLISVSNEGEVIPHEELKRIFKRFYRLDKARTTGESYGLGLAIAESIVHEQGGKIWAESENGKNTFWIQLPIIRKVS